MSSKALRLTLAVLACLVVPTIQADTLQFGGLNFTLTNTESDGSAAVSSDGSMLQITGPNDGSGLPGTTVLTTTIPAAGTVTFQWSYFSLDLPGYDDAGYLLGGTFTQLSDASGDSGSITLSAAAGEEFGFEGDSADNQGEPGVLTVSDFSAPLGTASAVPEPGTWALLTLGIVLAFVRFLPVRHDVPVWGGQREEL